MSLFFLCAALVAAGNNYHEQVFRKLVSTADTGVIEYRRRRTLATNDRTRLDATVARFDASGYRLRVVLVDAGATFSLGDFTTRAWRHLRPGPDDVLVVASSTGVHGKAPWTTYAEVRRIVAQHTSGSSTDNIERLAEYILSEGHARTRHRRIMLSLAAAASLGFVGVGARALARRRQRHG